ncbi:outer membrane beta-barrel protein [Vibrio comitans]
MKKSIIALALASLASFNAMADNDFSGHRISLGTTNTGDVSWTMQPDSSATPITTSAKTQSFNLTYSYDFSRFISLNTEYMYTSGKGGAVVDTPHHNVITDLRSDQHSFGAEGELGYAFSVDSWQVKPFVTGGVVITTGRAIGNSTVNGATGNDDVRLDGSGVTTGFGLRAVSPWGVFAEVKTRKADFGDKANKVLELSNESLTTFNIGYKF